MKPKGKKKIENEIEELEKECNWLKSELQKSQKRNKELSADNMELRRAGLPLDLRRKLDKDPMKLYHFVIDSLQTKKINYR